MVLDSIDNDSDNSLGALKELATSCLRGIGANAAESETCDTPDAGSLPHAHLILVESKCGSLEMNYFLPASPCPSMGKFKHSHTMGQK